MPTATLNLYSESLGSPQNVSIISPRAEHLEGASILYLLHGLLDDHTSWLTRTRLLDYAEQYRLIVVMPYAMRSFYTDQSAGYGWRSWIEQELPEQIEGLIAFAQRGENRHIAGLSMGGYGAMKLGLSQPHRFASMASFSGVLDLASIREYHRWEVVENDIRLAFGSPEAIANSKDDLFTLLDQPSIPPLFVRCGLEDSLIIGARKFHKAVTDRSLQCDYLEVPGGHTWSVWDRDISDYLSWLAEKGLLAKV